MSKRLSRRSKKATHRKRRLMSETLETRQLLAGDVMAIGENGFTVESVFTIGETLDSANAYDNPTDVSEGYTPPGVLDGLGAYELDEDTVRVLANHELLNFRGYEYQVSDGSGGSFSMIGARVSYFDIDKDSREIVDAGLAYNTIYDANGVVAQDTSFLLEGFGGFSRFCSSVLVEPHQFGEGRGTEDRIYFTGEEDGGNFNPVGGAEWALDPASGEIWAIPAMGRGAWENITEVDTGTTDHVAFILADDSSPFDTDNDGESEAAPLFLYVGEKSTAADANFLERNGLSDGQLFVWVSDSGETLPSEFNTSGSLAGSWVEVDNSQNLALASEDGSSGYDEFGYPTQRNLWTQAEGLGAFGFSRPEDVAVNPEDGSEIILASTGVDTYDVDPVSGDGVDTFGTMYTIKSDFSDISNPTSTVTILYDGDADVENRALRSPDNLDWADDGFIYVQEDEAEEDTLGGENLFGDDATNPNEASIVRIDPNTGEIQRVAQIDREVILDPTTTGTPFDTDAGAAGEWETSGIIDVSTLFDEDPGSLFLFDIQAHGIEDQTDSNPDSRINDTDLVEGGQLAFLISKPTATLDDDGTLLVKGTANDDRLTIVKRGKHLAVFSGSDLIGRFLKKEVKDIRIDGYDGDDVLRVSKKIRQDATIDGGAGNDLIVGGRGDDVLIGGEGHDLIFGGRGNDFLDGGEGIDLLIGGRGRDVTINGISLW